MTVNLIMFNHSLGYKDKKTGKVYNEKSMGNLIREGNRIVVECYELGIDYTKETLVKIAFQSVLKSGLKYDTEFTIVEMISEIVDEETLYTVIEHGNMENYIIKKRRGAIHE